MGAPFEAGSDGPNVGGAISSAHRGLLARIAVSFGVLAVGLTVAFALLFIAVTDLRQRSLEARHSQQVIAAANGLQTLVIDFETGLRGFVITNQERYLEPWRVARARYPNEMSALLRLTADNPRQQAAARQIKAAVDAYLQDFSLPLVKFMRRNPGEARKVIASGTGSRQIDRIRGLFGRFLDEEERRSAAMNREVRQTARTAHLIGGMGLGLALLFLLGAAAYLERAVARPIRRAARAARRVAAGDLSGRLPFDGPGEVGQLERAFNAMAASLEQSHGDLEERNRRLVESERLKTELVSNVSHELRTPLASVLGFTEAARLATLLNDLLDLQRHERGVLELILEEFDLNEFLDVQVMLYSAQSEVHTITYRPADEAPIIEGDRDRLAQVIGNLLSNAIKYSPDGGHVAVTAAVIRGDAWIWVRDEGLGIPGEHQGQIFTKFFRGDAARKRGISGTGLGLVLSRQIVEAHGGEIGFDSTEGTGSTFWIRIPAVAGASAPAPGDRTETRHRM